MSKDIEEHKNHFITPHPTIALCFIKVEQQYKSRGLSVGDWKTVLDALVDWKMGNSEELEQSCEQFRGNIKDVAALSGNQRKINDLINTIASYLDGRKGRIKVLAATITPGEFDFIIVIRFKDPAHVAGFVVDVLCGPILGKHVRDTQIMMAVLFSASDRLCDALKGGTEDISGVKNNVD